ncbi:MAG: hypothetical protein HYV35_02595 [Lentisphaerae bacterium]|nr:hypothetical protein [Lentisphaerota bacterium]
MSEYQYYEWQTIDRLLTEKEQEAVSRLSSHIDVSSSRAVVTYHWGDFKHDARTVLVRLPSGNEWKPYANDIRSALDSSIAFRPPSYFMKNRRPALKKMIAEPGKHSHPLSNVWFQFLQDSLTRGRSPVLRKEFDSLSRIRCCPLLQTVAYGKSRSKSYIKTRLTAGKKGATTQIAP